MNVGGWWFKQFRGLLTLGIPRLDHHEQNNRLPGYNSSYPYGGPSACYWMADRNYFSLANCDKNEKQHPLKDSVE